MNFRRIQKQDKYELGQHIKPLASKVRDLALIFATRSSYTPEEIGKVNDELSALRAETEELRILFNLFMERASKGQERWSSGK